MKKSQDMRRVFLSHPQTKCQSTDRNFIWTRAKLFWKFLFWLDLFNNALRLPWPSQAKWICMLPTSAFSFRYTKKYTLQTFVLLYFSKHLFIEEIYSMFSLSALGFWDTLITTGQSLCRCVSVVETCLAVHNAPKIYNSDFCPIIFSPVCL